MRSNSSKIVLPKIVDSFSGPKERVQNAPMMNTTMVLISDAVLRFQCNSSTAKATRISSREMVEVRAAMPSNTKKMTANSVPAGILLNTLGSTI